MLDRKIAERLLQKAGLADDKIEGIMEEIRGLRVIAMWEKLGNVDEEVLGTFLQKEYPQTVAVVLSKNIIRPRHVRVALCFRKLSH